MTDLANATTIPSLTLNNHRLIPQEGLGVFQMTDFNTCKQAVLSALHSGYRLIDTAQVYQNEAAVGAALQVAAVPRDELFITTKVWLTAYGQQQTVESVKKSLTRLHLDYLDLVLLHEPYGDYYGAYRGLEQLVTAGLVRTIGVSNFDAGQLLDLSHQMSIKPAVNQVELNLYQQQAPLRRNQRSAGIALEAWAPFGEAPAQLFAEPTVQQLSRQHDKTPAQILLRYLTQLGAIVIPKTVHATRMRENQALWDFALTPTDLHQLAALDRGHWLSPDRHSLAATQHYMDLIDADSDSESESSNGRV